MHDFSFNLKILALRGDHQTNHVVRRFQKTINPLNAIKRFVVRSPKTEHHAGQDKRVVPLFPELRRELEKLFSSVELADNEFVIQGYQRTSWVLYAPFQEIADSAGLGRIVSPFVNMRRSRNNEVLRKHGSQLESLWIGHSEKVMEEHYFDLEDEDFLQAVGE